MRSASEHDPAGGAAAPRVRVLREPREVDLALALRQTVFCGEQGVRPAAERDGRDLAALHLGAFEDGALVGTCRLLASGGAGALVVQRVAVRADRRRRGVGRALIAAARDRARVTGVRALSLHAQLESESFYLVQGFARCGRPFFEEGIEHVAVRCECSGQPLS